MVRILVVAALLLAALPAWAGSWRGVSFGLGVAGGYDPVVHWPSVSPMASVGIELGGPEVRAWIGVDSAPFFVSPIGYDVAGLTFAMLTVGGSGGNDRLRVGGHATIGVVGIGVGAHVRYLPLQVRKGGRHGFEVRAEWFWKTTIRAVVMYTFRPSWGLRDDGV